ncbi:MAG: orotidine-5'-phosphate decarboxylase, partial [bacterium]
MTTDPMTPPIRSPLDYLVVALDMPSADLALDMANRLEGSVRWVKVGLELFVTTGPPMIETLRARGFEVFLDLKFHDIPNTVAGASAAAARTGAGIINVHAGGGIDMMIAAKDGALRGARERGTPAPTMLAVTVLTSLTGEELPGYYQSRTVEERVLYLAQATREAGLDGVVCSPREVTPLRVSLGPDFKLLTPGLRFADG